MPTHIKLDADEIGLYDDSTILFEQSITIPKDKVAYKIADIPKRLVSAANMALSISLGLQ
ncbi:hypothetical protein EDO6_00006 [Paenibacillus xylanexedens]|nr:hypothetical protein EDO6_00006 [Paenibacillus xylanexedens]